jgi:hypothetical protein
MPYQNVSTPRIYLNIPEYLASTGTDIDPVFRTLPVSVNSYTDETSVSIPAGILGTQCFVAILGHTLKTAGTDYAVTEADTLVPVVNGTPASGLDGFSISTFGVTGGTSLTVTGISGKMTVCTGIYYDFPYSPDLKLSLSYEYEGIKETTTKGGSTLTNAFYTKPPKWTDTLGAWELGGTAAYAKSGRRVWDLSFSYLSDSSVFPTNAGLVNEATDATTGDPTTTNTLLEADSFQRVIHLTNGGQIPFIFQSDGTVDDTSPKPDQLAIAKFDMNSFKFDQVANSVYNCKIRIREVW